MNREDQVQQVLDAFGPCSCAYECHSVKEIIEEIDSPGQWTPDSLREWAGLLLIVEEVQEDGMSTSEYHTFDRDRLEAMKSRVMAKLTELGQ